MGNIFKLLIVIAIGFAVYGVFKADPEGINIEGTVYTVPASSVGFYEDLTYVNDSGVRLSEQEIFDKVFGMIRGAQNYILIDMFLFNDFLGTSAGSYRQLSEELVNELVSKKEAVPSIDIVLITDPINTVYGGYDSPHLNKLKDAGIHVVVTDLEVLQDSNPIASGFWRAYFSWFGNSTKEGYLPNPFDENLPKLGIRSYASLLNFKANHRKIMIADKSTPQGVKFSTLVTSANPHDGSSAHTNTAIVIDDYIWKDVLESELAVAEFSNVVIPKPKEEFLNRINDVEGGVKVQLLTEEKIRDGLIKTISALKEGDTLDIAMFYLSERKVIQEIEDAASRKVKVRILLDPNKDAFGREKNGIPNRSVAFELFEIGNDIKVRWCDTHGEQCHTKMVMTKTNKGYSLLIGSANITRRNIGGYNLESNILIESQSLFGALNEARAYFEKVWNNESGKTYSTEYNTYKDHSYGKSVTYRLMEDLGVSSF